MCNKWHQHSNAVLYLPLKSLPFREILMAISLSDKLQAKKLITSNACIHTYRAPIPHPGGGVQALLYFLNDFPAPNHRSSSHVTNPDLWPQPWELCWGFIVHVCPINLPEGGLLVQPWPQSGCLVDVVIMTPKDQSAVWVWRAANKVTSANRLGR